MSKDEVTYLTDDELEFYSRQIVLQEIGYKGQLKLKNAKVCIVGLGGLGSHEALQLASMGVGYIRLVDHDFVELSNLQRQPLYDVNYLGFPKVEVASKKLRELNPHIEIDPLPLFLNTSNAENIISGVDVVVDGLDRMTPRYALNRACQKLGIPYVFGAAVMTFGNVSTIIPGETACLECFQGNLDDDTLPKCAVVGVHPSILSIIASVEVSEVTEVILGKKPQLANKLLHCDLSNMMFEKVALSKAENCPVCGTKPLGPPMLLRHDLINELCGRGGKRVLVITPRKEVKININEFDSLLERIGFKIDVKAELGLTFHNDLNWVIRVTNTGIMIIEGARNKKEAYEFYKKIMVHELKLPNSTIS